MYCTKIDFEESYSGYQIHQKLMTLFQKNENPRILFQKNGSSVTVLSRTKPIESLGFSFEVKDYTEKDVLPFSLRLNPVKRDPKTKKKTLPVRSLQYKEWVQKKASLCGFKILDMQIESEGRLEGKNGHPINSLFAKGILEVENADLFMKKLEEGIPGPEKHVGFGMLNVFVW